MRTRTKTLVLPPFPTDVPPPPPAATNEALIARIQGGDGDALWILHSRHSDFLREVIARYLSEEEDCEDVLREVFEDIRDRAVHYRREFGPALGWMMTLTRRRALQRASQVTRRPPQPVEQEAAAPFGALRSWLKHAFGMGNLRPTTQPAGH
jgi:DNA-directed RNA polymerase specialized sigma24 family protein